MAVSQGVGRHGSNEVSLRCGLEGSSTTGIKIAIESAEGGREEEKKNRSLVLSEKRSKRVNRRR